MPLYKGSRYLDLFDDDLYPWQEVEQTETFADHLDNIRLQMMASILFDGRIVVPEQWLISSPTFCRPSAEIVGPWLALRLAGRAPPDLRGRPIVPACFSSRADGDAAARLLQALVDRLGDEG